MPTVFISYARGDLDAVQKLEQALTANGIAAWRDQKSLYGGQQWPKAIGEAILANDFLLLVWSKNAAKSHFVEFEWTTAIALRKTILPCLLDDTQLPPALRAINGISLKIFDDALTKKILRSLRIPATEVDPEHSSKVIKKLQEITPTEPEKVVQAVKTIFEQQNWNVQGNVYQAGGDIHVTIGKQVENAEKGLFEKWQSWATLLIALLTIVTLLLDLPKKIKDIVKPDKTNVTDMKAPENSDKQDAINMQEIQTLAGLVWDEEHNPLAGVEVFLPQFNVTYTTDRNGKFSFQAKALKQQSVDLIARKNGYETYDVEATLGNTSFNFTMRRKKK